MRVRRAASLQSMIFRSLPARLGRRRLLLYGVAAVLGLGLIGAGVYLLVKEDQPATPRTGNTAAKENNDEHEHVHDARPGTENGQTPGKITNEQAVIGQKDVTKADGNFAAVSPPNNYATPSGDMEFIWKPHYKATKYQLELRKDGQSDYETADASRTVTLPAGQTQPAQISYITKVPQGTYTWRVVAVGTVDSKETRLQVTAERRLTAQ